MEGRNGNIISDDLVRQAFSEFQSKKTPGPDGLKPVVLYHLPPNIIRLISVVYKSCLTVQFGPPLEAVACRLVLRCAGISDIKDLFTD